MTLKIRLIVLQFLQFFILGAWILTIGAYWFQTKEWSGTEFGAIFSTIGLASLFMPALAGIIADRWINAEKLYGLLHLAGAVTWFFVPQVDDPTTMFWIMLLSMIWYTPTISLSVTVSYSAMKDAGLDIIKDFPPIRVWGTIGFIVALFQIDNAAMERRHAFGPDDALVVMTGFDNGAYQTADTDSMAAHMHRRRFAIGSLYFRVHCLGVLGAKVKNLANFNAARNALPLLRDLGK